MKKRSFLIGLAAFTVTLGMIGGAWAMAVVELNSSQRVSQLVQEASPFVRFSHLEWDPAPVAQALDRWPGLQVLLPRGLRIGVEAMKLLTA